MAKKVWYEIELIDTRKQDPANSTEIIARVKSKGLANIVYNEIKEVYNDMENILVHVK